MLRFVPIVRPPRPPALWNVGPARQSPPEISWFRQPGGTDVLLDWSLVAIGEAST
jgi:hypothetical protein